MFGTRRFPKAPVLEYQVRRRSGTNCVAHSEQFGLESACVLSQKYLDICDKNSLDAYIELSEPEYLLEAANTFMSEELSNKLMNTEAGQGLMLGYLWSCVDWSQGVLEVVPDECNP